MTKRERVLAAINHKPVDKVVKGELYIQPKLCNEILGEEYPDDYYHFERDWKTCEKLGMDLINVGDWPMWEIGRDIKGNRIVKSVYGQTLLEGRQTKRLMKPPLDIEDAENYPEPDIRKVSGELVSRFAKDTDLFVFAQICGPISMLNEMFPMEDYLVNCLTYPEETKIISDRVIAYEIKKAKLFLDSGADGIVVTDDMAYNTGVFLPPYTMDDLVYPYYRQMIREIKAYKNVPVVIHTDGNVNSILPEIVDCGFDVLQSLQPSAGMDIAQVKARYGDVICLWGNIDLNYVLSQGSEEEVREAVNRTIAIAQPGSGFILSSCNCLMDTVPLRNVYAMMDEAEKYKVK